MVQPTPGLPAAHYQSLVFFCWGGNLQSQQKMVKSYAEPWVMRKVGEMRVTNEVKP